MGKVDTRKNHGLRCLGVSGKREACTRARDGGRVWLNKRCQKCGEQRCKKHCACGRKKAAAPAAAATVPAPVGRAPAQSTELLANAAEMYDKCCAEIGRATEVEMATYQYDNVQVHGVLLKRLRIAGKDAIFAKSVHRSGAAGRKDSQDAAQAGY